MVGTIAPAGRRARRERDWLAVNPSIVFALSAAVTAGIVGFLLGSLGSGLGLTINRWTLALVALVALAAAFVESREVRPRLSLFRAQVPPTWATYLGTRRAAVAYGSVLGVGFATRIPHSSIYVVALSALFIGRFGAFFVWSLYGVGRAIPVVTATYSKQELEPDLWNQKTSALTSQVRKACSLMLASTAVMLTAVLVGELLSSGSADPSGL